MNADIHIHMKLGQLRKVLRKLDYMSGDSDLDLSLLLDGDKSASLTLYATSSFDDGSGLDGEADIDIPANRIQIFNT